MIFTIGAVAFIVGLLIFNFYETSFGPWGYSPGAKVGLILMLTGLVTMLTSILTLAWWYLP